MLIASLSLMALPFMSGFYSKDFILESAYGQFYFSSKVIYFLALIGAMFTALYSIKITYLTFISTPNGYLTDYKKAHEGDLYMTIPLIILAIFSIFFGYLTKDMFIGLGTGFFSDNAIFMHPMHEIMLETEFALPIIIKTLPIFITIISYIIYTSYIKRFLLFLFLTLIIYMFGAYLSFINNIVYVSLLSALLSLFIFKLLNNNYNNIYISIYKLYIHSVVYIKLKFNINLLLLTFAYSKFTINLVNLFNQRLFIELFYNKFISEEFLKFGGQTTKVIDKGSIEYIGPYGMEIGLTHIGKKISKLDSGIIISYALYILTGFVVYLYILNTLNVDELIIIILLGFMYI
jgi:NADH-ubiquinone oxidoreductase chain 5